MNYHAIVPQEKLNQLFSKYKFEDFWKKNFKLIEKETTPTSFIELHFAGHLITAIPNDSRIILDAERKFKRLAKVVYEQKLEDNSFRL